MWKTRIKISKILTNIHAGFVTALLGYVLTFAPLSAMGDDFGGNLYFSDGQSSHSCSLTSTRPSMSYNLPTSTTVLSCAAYAATAWLKAADGTYYNIPYCNCPDDYDVEWDTLLNLSSYCGYYATTITRAVGCVQSCSATTVTSTSSCYSSSVSNSLENCASASVYCYGGKKVQTCDTCKSGWTKATKYQTVSGCDSYAYSTCSKCLTDAACGTNATTYSSSGYTGCEQKIYYTCSSSGTCSSGYNRRCKAGYYGTPTSSCSGACTACPTDSKSGVAGTSTVGSDEIGDCYIASGRPFTDDIGTGTYSGTCYY